MVGPLRQLGRVTAPVGNVAGIDQEPHARALAQARLDLHVLSAKAIFVGRPVPVGKNANAADLMTNAPSPVDAQQLADLQIGLALRQASEG